MLLGGWRAFHRRATSGHQHTHIGNGAEYSRIMRVRLPVVDRSTPASRQQRRALKRTTKCPHFRTRDRVFWIALARIWRNWRTALVPVQPDTVVRWHRDWLRRQWTRRSRPRPSGRPTIKRQILANDKPTRCCKGSSLRRDRVATTNSFLSSSAVVRGEGLTRRYANPETALIQSVFRSGGAAEER